MTPQRKHVATGQPKGHWPAGKTRHPAAATTIAALARLLETPIRGSISVRAIAANIGVSDRTLRRWLDGTHNPSPDHARRLKALTGKLSHSRERGNLGEN